MSPETLRVVLADDEPLARELVRGYALGHADLTVVGECETGDALVEALARLRPDVALLDIRMPGANVFDVLANAAGAHALPAVIFTTAYDGYAVRAFELNAVDYLVKPFTEDRFSAAIDRVRARQAPGRQQEALIRVIRDLGPRPDRLLVPDGDRMVPIAVTDIAWIKAEGDYARIHSAGRSYLVSRTLKELEDRLDPAQFLRIHRSAIVRGDQIREVRGEGSNRYRVLLHDGTTLIVSRTRAPELRRWIL